jgi:hypothetical protein
MAPQLLRATVLNKRIRTYYAKLARDSELLLCRKGTTTEKMGLEYPLEIIGFRRLYSMKKLGVGKIFP